MTDRKVEFETNFDDEESTEVLPRYTNSADYFDLRGRIEAPKAEAPDVPNRNALAENPEE